MFQAFRRTVGTGHPTARNAKLAVHLRFTSRGRTVLAAKRSRAWMMWLAKGIGGMALLVIAFLLMQLTVAGQIAAPLGL